MKQDRTGTTVSTRPVPLRVVRPAMAPRPTVTASDAELRQLTEYMRRAQHAKARAQQAGTLRPVPHGISRPLLRLIPGGATCSTNPLDDYRNNQQTPKPTPVREQPAPAPADHNGGAA